MELLSCGGTCRADTRSCASTRPSASKVETDSSPPSGRAWASSSTRASSRGRSGGRAFTGSPPPDALRCYSCELLRVVVETAAIVDQPLRQDVRLVQIQHRPQGRLGQLGR